MTKNNKRWYFIGGILITIIIIIGLPQCSRVFEVMGGFCGYSKKDYCESNTDCVRGGCSGEVCHSTLSPMFGTTCEWRECYNSKLYNLNCGCINNQCQWSK